MLFRFPKIKIIFFPKEFADDEVSFCIKLLSNVDVLSALDERQVPLRACRRLRDRLPTHRAYNKDCVTCDRPRKTARKKEGL